MKYAELLEKLNALSPEQLEQTAIVTSEVCGGPIESVWIAEEDWCGESEDEASPRSAYTDPQDAEDDGVLWPKGTVHIEF